MPSVVSWGKKRLDVFGVGLDSQLHHKWWDGTKRAPDGGHWFPSTVDWEPMGGVLGGAPTVVSWGRDRLDVFGIGLDSQMYHKAFDGSKWSDWEPMGGQLTSPVVVASWGGNRLDVFGAGTDSGMYHQAWDGSSWSGWEPLGGKFSSAPAVVSRASGILDVFGIGTDSQVMHRAWNGSSWEPSTWESLGTVPGPDLGNIRPIDAAAKASKAPRRE
jgi:hypothetical protein